MLGVQDSPSSSEPKHWKKTERPELATLPPSTRGRCVSPAMSKLAGEFALHQQLLLRLHFHQPNFHETSSLTLKQTKTNKQTIRIGKSRKSTKNKKPKYKAYFDFLEDSTRASFSRHRHANHFIGSFPRRRCSKNFGRWRKALPVIR